MSPGPPRLGPIVVVGLAGAGLAAVSSAQVWARAEAEVPAVRVVEAGGADVAPVALPLSLVALAAWGAVLVLRRRGRRVVALVGLAAASAVVVAVALRVGSAGQTARDLLASGAGDGVAAETTAWPYAAGLGALAAAAAFVAAYRAAPHWPEMSSRYDAPGGRGRRDDGATGVSAEEASPGQLWKALDEGRDPTE